MTMLALRCLAHGFIVTSLLWASSLSAILDRRMYPRGAVSDRGGGV